MTPLMLLALSVLSLAPRAHAQDQMNSLVCNNAFQNLAVAAEFSTPDQTAATIAEKLTENYPILYSQRFIDHVLANFEQQFDLKPNYHSNYRFQSKALRAKMTDVQTNPKGYESALNNIANNVLSNLHDDFSGEAAAKMAQAYQISQKDFETAQQLVRLLRKNPLLESATKQLFAGMILNMIDLLKTYTRIKKLSQNTQFRVRNNPYRIWPFIPFSPSAYRWAGYASYYAVARKPAVKRAINTAKNKEMPLTLPNGAAIASARTPVEESFEQLRARLSRIPEASLANHKNVAEYDTDFSDTYYKMSLKGLSLREQFADPLIWKQFQTTIQSQIDGMNPQHPVYTQIILVLGRMKKHLQAHLLQTKEQAYALATAIDTLGVMEAQVKRSIETYAGGTTATEKRLQDERERLLTRLGDLRIESEAMLAYLDGATQSTSVSLQTLQGLLGSLSGGRKPNLGELQAKIDQIAETALAELPADEE